MKLSTQIRSILKRTALLALTLSTLALSELASQARDQVPFRAEWDSNLEFIADFPLATVIGNGTDLAAHLGGIAAHSVAETVNLVTGAGSADYRFVAANGDEVFVDFVFTAIPTSATVFVVTGVWQVTGGTGRLAGAVGSGTYDGGVEFTDADSAKGHFAMQGTISSPGSLK